MSKLLSAMALLLATAAIGVANATPRVAVMYSAFHDDAYKEAQTPMLKELGWSQDQYENTKVGDLLPKLDEYDLVILGNVYNYENPQDLAKNADQWRQYLERGGCILVEDANYPQVSYWLESIHPSLRWIGAGAMNPFGESPVKWADKEHPLLQGARLPGTPWTCPRAWSQMLTPVVMDAGGRPVIAYSEVGKGVVVISSAYTQYGFPDANFIRNLVTWAKDPARTAAAVQRSQAIAGLSRSDARIALPKLAKAPTIDGALDADEWSGAAKVDDFIAMIGDVPSTECRVAQSGDSIYVAFRCSDPDIANASAKRTERDDSSWLDDSIEVFLDPTGKRVESFTFAVNSIGTLFDSRDGDPSWDASWTAKTSVGKSEWTAEIRIPFSALSADGRQLADTCGVNFDRRYVNRTGRGQSISGWSPSPGGFAAPAGYGMLTGVADSIARPIGPVLAVSSPKRWMVGSNSVMVTATKNAGATGKVRLVCLNAQTGVAVSQTQPVDPAAKPIRAEFPIDTDGDHMIQFIAVDPADSARVIAGSPIIRFTAEPAFTVRMREPAFRGAIQSKDPRKNLLLEGEVGSINASGLTVRASITLDGRSTPCRQYSQRTTSSGSFRIAAPLADLPYGSYTLRVDLTGEGGRLLGTTTMPMKVLPPAPMEVTFDERRACYIDGKPFFPIGLYHTAPAVLDALNARSREIGLPELNLDDTLKDIKAHGFNCVHHSWVMASDEYIAAASKLGLYVIPEVGAPDPESLKKMVATANAFRNILIWYGVDEPAGERLQAAMDAHSLFAEMDPHRPVSAACCNPAVFPGGAKAYDIMMMDPYFVRYASLTEIANWIQLGDDAVKGLKPIWVVPQAFTISNSPWSEPTNEELRCQAYISLAHGATGLIWYAYWSSEPYKENPKGRNQWYLPDSGLWEYFPKLNAEIQTLAPAILTGVTKGKVACSSDQIHTNSWVKDGSLYVVAVNPTNKPVNCTIGAGIASGVEVMFESRKATVSNGAVKDSFKPLEVHVYRFQTSPAGK